MSNTSVTTTLADFLAAIHPPDADGLIDLRALPSEQQEFVEPSDADGVARFLRVHATENCYFGVAARKSRVNGKLENCGELHALYCEIDFKDTPEAEARARLERFPLKPSIIIASGGGLHVYWKLREPLNLQDPADVKRTYGILRRLAPALGADPLCAQPACILRIPGTFNYKYAPPRRVEIETFEPERQYNLCDLDDFLPEEPEPQNGNGRGFTVGERIKDGTRNDTLYKLARSEKARGLSLKASHVALRVMNAERCEPPLTEQEVEQIAHHAFKQTDRPDFEQNGRNGASGGSGGTAGFELRPLDLTRLDEVSPAPAWAIEGRIAVGDIALLSGDSGSYKTWLDLQLAIDLSCERPIFGQFSHPGSEFGRIMVIDEENHGDLLRRRLALLTRGAVAPPG